MVGMGIRGRYAGSILGILWNLIHPLILILVFWTIFSVGFKVKPKEDVPFVVWLVSGMSAWFFFAEAVNGAAASVVGNANIIKKTLFKSQILPLVRIITPLIQHGVFVFLLILLMILNHLQFSIYWFQALYYLFCLMFIATGIGWVVSALNVFIRDTQQITTVALQVGFWVTPIFWEIQMMPAQIQTLLKLNPLFYIIQGYRDSFIYHVPFWEHPYLTLFFWGTSICFFLLGVWIFSQLKPHFADAL